MRTFNQKIMVIINSREFRNNQKKYFDLVDKKQQVVINRGKSAYILSPIKEEDRIYFDEKLKASIREGMEEMKAGKTIEITDVKKYLDDL